MVGADIFEMSGVHVSDWTAYDIVGSSYLDAVVAGSPDRVGIYLSNRYDISRSRWSTFIPQVPSADLHLIRHLVPDYLLSSSEADTSSDDAVDVPDDSHQNHKHVGPYYRTNSS